MKNRQRYTVVSAVFPRLLFIFLLWGACLLPLANAQAKALEKKQQIAFIADIHLHAPVAAAKGIPSALLPKDPATQQPVLLRSMQAQLHSTRLFNENSVVLRTALEDIAEQGIQLVALPGDFSDDGQPANIEALNAILNEYTEKYGMRFFAINGNHDPVRPFTRPGGKADFLAAEGNDIRVVSPLHKDCISGKAVHCSDGVKEWGYKEIANALAAHGFQPHSSDILYETPFGTADLAKRAWQWCDDNVNCIAMPDMSYLVEPTEGLWLLAIDANVYIPESDSGMGKFKGSSNAGYNALREYKPQLIEWIANLVQRAKRENKLLVSFSHFPMADFYDDQASAMARVFGQNTMQLSRLPTAKTTAILANTGLKLHFGGHMHLFDISRIQPQGLLNVQVPSLAAYQPGYTVLKLAPSGEALIETKVVKNVPQFTRWFPIYAKEWQFRRAHNLNVWDKNILNAPDYLSFTDEHLKQIIHHRYLVKEWPESVVNTLTQSTIGDIVARLGYTLSGPQYDEVLSQDAITLVYDFYRARNAGSFANLNGRRAFYRALDRVFRNRRPSLSIASQAANAKPTEQLEAVISMIIETVERASKDTAIQTLNLRG